MGVVAVMVGSPGDRRRNFFLGLLCIVGFLYGVPKVASNLALSAWETDLIQVALAGCTCFFILRGMRATGARGQTQVPDRPAAAESAISPPGWHWPPSDSWRFS